MITPGRSGLLARPSASHTSRPSAALALGAPTQQQQLDLAAAAAPHPEHARPPHARVVHDQQRALRQQLRQLANRADARSRRGRAPAADSRRAPPTAAWRSARRVSRSPAAPCARGCIAEPERWGSGVRVRGQSAEGPGKQGALHPASRTPNRRPRGSEPPNARPPRQRSVARLRAPRAAPLLPHPSALTPAPDSCTLEPLSGSRTRCPGASSCARASSG